MLSEPRTIKLENLHEPESFVRRYFKRTQRGGTSLVLKTLSFFGGKVSISIKAFNLKNLRLSSKQPRRDFSVSDQDMKGLPELTMSTPH